MIFIARNYNALAVKFYPTDIREDDLIFLSFLNDARIEICLRANLKQTYELDLVEEQTIYHIPVHQGIISVYYYNPQIDKWIVLNRTLQPSTTSTPLNKALQVVGYQMDNVNYKIILKGEPAENSKLRVNYVIYPEPLQTWDSVENTIPATYFRATAILYARNLATYDMRYEIASYLDKLVDREIVFNQHLRS